MRMKDKVAVVTGGASGIGKRTVERFVAEGGKAVIADIQDDRGLRMVEELGAAVRYARCDVTVEADIAGAIQTAVDAWGRLDLMFNNAGTGGDPSPIETITVEGWDGTMNLLVRGVMLGIKHATPVMKRQGSGCIVNTASVAGLLPGATPAAYAVAKSAVAYLTKCAAMELAEHSIRVNCIAPGLIATPIIGKSMGLAGQVADRMVEVVEKVGAAFQPLPRGGRTDDIAGAVLYFASDEAQWVTGVVMPVDGGIAAGRTPADMAGAWNKIAEAIGGEWSANEAGG
jgi:NAD(P)-dependent dehydrogenase (short-subunit alcohol dehydrogenase family)